MPGRAEDFGIWKKQFSWDLCLDEESRFSELAEARPVVCGGGASRGGVQTEKSARKEIVSLSLLMSKNLKLKKVIKSFVPEPISCFSNSYMFMNIVNVFRIGMNTCTFHILISCYVASLMEPLHQIVYYHIQDTCWGVLPFCSDAVGVFYYPSWLGQRKIEKRWFNRIWHFKPSFNGAQLCCENTKVV